MEMSEVGVYVIAGVFILVNLVYVYAILRLFAQVTRLKEILANDMFVTFDSMNNPDDLGELPTLGAGSGTFWIE